MYYGQSRSQLLKPGLVVEKGTNTVISKNFGVFVERKFNKLQSEFWTREHPQDSFSTATSRLHSRSRATGGLSVNVFVKISFHSLTGPELAFDVDRLTSPIRVA